LAWALLTDKGKIFPDESSDLEYNETLLLAKTIDLKRV